MDIEVICNLFAAGELKLPEVCISVDTAYPFGDTVTFTVQEGAARLGIRIPAFSAKRYTLSAPAEYRDGYCYLDVKAGDVITLTLDMTPRLNRANPRVARASGMAAVTVGPVVYCAEGADNGGDVLSFTLNGGLQRQDMTPAHKESFGPEAVQLGNVYTVLADGSSLRPADPEALYFTDEYTEEPRTLRLIPYFMWGNRGLNQMRVWFPAK